MKNIVFYLILSLLLFLQNSFSFAQNISIRYIVTRNWVTVPMDKNTTWNLIIKNNESIYYNDMQDSLNMFEYKNLTNNYEKIGNVPPINVREKPNPKSTVQDLFYKNYESNLLIYNEVLVFSSKAVIGENLQLLNWKLVNTKDTLILGYKCQTATADFRGRKYTAYFNQELNSQGGPWKFDGLPGLILAVKSHDNYFAIEAITVSLNTAKEPIGNPYRELKKEEILTWEQFKEKMEQRMRKLAKKFKAQNDDGSTLSIKITDKIEDLGISEIKSEK